MLKRKMAKKKNEDWWWRHWDDSQDGGGKVSYRLKFFSFYPSVLLLSLRKGVCVRSSYTTSDVHINHTVANKGKKRNFFLLISRFLTVKKKKVMINEWYRIIYYIFSRDFPVKIKLNLTVEKWSFQTDSVGLWNSLNALIGFWTFFCDPLRTFARTSSGFSGRTNGFFSGAFIFQTTMGDYKI